MSSQDLDPKQSTDPETLNEPEPKQPPNEESEAGGGGGEEEEDEEGECGFCLFMKAGGCKESFIGWENCIREAEENKEDIVEKCFEATAALKKCMEAHSDYYEPILRAERKAEEQAIIELEKEKEEMDLGSQEDSKDLQKKSEGHRYMLIVKIIFYGI
ncbi:cytochrome b-c1 complex subunit 6-like [Hibiscus syriacus]|uniref:cytochrome b-c1 complex subunit 6-like n=1 Tax=Hibiscus syriacus TaxID=106335 RepID=UPI001924A1AF|nr:cytochrome b-c1 complex subunit 6-like [Hibiscus syriacus]